MPTSSATTIDPELARRIRILQLGATLTIGGSERCFIEIARGLDPQRYVTHFAGLGIDGPFGEELRREGHVAQAFLRKDGFDKQLYRQLWKFLNQHPVDILQTHHIASLIYGGPIAKCKGIKIIHTEHDIHNFTQHPQNLRWLHLLKNLPTYFVGIDPSIADFLINEGKIPKERVWVIRNGVNMSTFSPIGRKPHQPDLFQIGWVARLTPPKRPEIVIDAMADLLPKYPQVRLKVIGQGDLLESLKQQASERGVAHVVDFLGPRFDIAEQLKTLDAYVLASDMEGLPISLVEAMASELPCVVSGVGGIPAVVKDGVNGLLLERNESALLSAQLEKLIQKPDFAQSLGPNARKTVSATYSFEASMAQYRNLYEQLVAKDAGLPGPPPNNSNGRKAAFSALHLTGVSELSRYYHRRELLIVTYHGVSDQSLDHHPSWVLLPEAEFAKQIEYLAKRYDLLPLKEAVTMLQEGKEFRRPTVCITFDDGYRNNAEIAFPILKKYNAPATIYVPTAAVGTDHVHWAIMLEQAVSETKEKQIDLTEIGLGIFTIGANYLDVHNSIKRMVYNAPTAQRKQLLDVVYRRLKFDPNQRTYPLYQTMNWDEIRTLKNTGLIDFGGHTVNHEITALLNNADAAFEIRESMAMLTKQLGETPFSFAFPNGTQIDFTQRDVNLVMETGAKAAVTAIDGLNTPSTNPFMLRRVSVGGTQRFQEFALMTSGLLTDLRRFFRGTRVS